MSLYFQNLKHWIVGQNEFESWKKGLENVVKLPLQIDKKPLKNYGKIFLTLRWHFELDTAVKDFKFPIYFYNISSKDAMGGFPDQSGDNWQIWSGTEEGKMEKLLWRRAPNIRMEASWQRSVSKKFCFIKCICVLISSKAWTLNHGSKWVWIMKKI